MRRARLRPVKPAPFDAQRANRARLAAQLASRARLAGGPSTEPTTVAPQEVAGRPQLTQRTKRPAPSGVAEESRAQKPLGGPAPPEATADQLWAKRSQALKSEEVSQETPEEPLVPTAK